MAKKRVINLDRLRSTERVRYGRANLTVERMVSVHATAVERALKAHRQGDASADDVAEAFIKEQVVSHTSSFSWADADLAKLLPRITAVANEPKLKAQTPADLVPELEDQEARERERWKKVNEQIRKAIAPTLPKLGLTIPKDFLKAYGQVPKLPIPGSLSNLGLETNKQILESLKANPNYDALLKSVQPDISMLSSLRVDLEKINKALRPQFPSLGVDLDRLNQMTGFRPGGEWYELMEQLAEAARKADAPEAADAAEATASESTLEPVEVDLLAIYERLKELLEHLAPEDSFRRAVIKSAIAMGIVRFIENLLSS